MILDASKTVLRINASEITRFSGYKNGFGCVQNQFWINTNKLGDFSVDKNGFGCIQNSTYGSMRAK